MVVVSGQAVSGINISILNIQESAKPLVSVALVQLRAMSIAIIHVAAKVQTIHENFFSRCARVTTYTNMGT